EDSCLFEDESDSEASEPDYDAEHGDPEVCRHVDTLVEELAEGVEEEDDFGLHEKVPVSRNHVANDVTSKKEGRVAPSQARVIVTTT
ncbi:hypothetical protein A2U01_0084285, partial [Trifolium medium]|nr:hypothetical protein [Trifolium medium]